MTEQKRSNKKDEQKATDVQYELEGAEGEITQVEARKSCVREGIDHILGPAPWLKAFVDRIGHHLVETLDLNLHNYRSAVSVALETPTTTHRGRLGRSVHVPATTITDNLEILRETIDGLCGLSASVN